MIQDKDTLKGYFESGDIPTESNFTDLIDTVFGLLQQITGLTLLNTGWTGVPGYYEYKLIVPEVSIDSKVEVVPENSTIDAVIDAGILPQVETGDGFVTIYAKNIPPNNILVTLNIQ